MDCRFSQNRYWCEDSVLSTGIAIRTSTEAAPVLVLSIYSTEYLLLVVTAPVPVGYSVRYKYRYKQFANRYIPVLDVTFCIQNACIVNRNLYPTRIIENLYRELYVNKRVHDAGSSKYKTPHSPPQYISRYKCDLNPVYSVIPVQYKLAVPVLY